LTDPTATGSGAASTTNLTAYEWDDADDFTETKEFFRTSEFWAFLLLVTAVLLAAYVSGEDSISREDGWRFATALGIGYMVARGLAKAGSREPKHDR
jgi:hypothetical protein